MFYNLLLYIWLYFNLHGFKGWQVCWNGGDPFATDVLGEHLLRQKGNWVRYKMLDPEFRSAPVRTSHASVWDAICSENVGRMVAVMALVGQHRLPLSASVLKRRLSWCDQHMILLGATLYGFLLLQVLRAIKAYLGAL